MGNPVFNEMKRELESKAYKNGRFCRGAGLGFTSDGKYDHEAREDLFRSFYSKLNDFVVFGIKDDLRESWEGGYEERDDEIQARCHGVLTCGRPI